MAPARLSDGRTSLSSAGWAAVRIAVVAAVYAWPISAGLEVAHLEDGPNG